MSDRTRIFAASWGGGAVGVVVAEGFRQRDAAGCVACPVARVVLPVAVRRLVVAHQEDRRRAAGTGVAADEVDRHVGDDIGGVAWDPAGVLRSR